MEVIVAQHQMIRIHQGLVHQEVAHPQTADQTLAHMTLTPIAMLTMTCQINKEMIEKIETNACIHCLFEVDSFVKN